MKSHSSSFPSLSHGLAASQVDRYLLDRAPAARSRSEEVEQHMPAITISRMLGIPARETAALVARGLGFHVFDREILEAVARDVRLGDRIVESLEEGKKSTLDTWLQACFGFETRVIDPASVHHVIGRVIRGISLHGSAVIVGRGANFILRGTDAFRVRLIAPLELRLQAVATGALGEPMTTALAQEEIERHAEERRAFMRRHFRADIDDLSAYDAVFNLRRLDPEHAARLIVDAYRAIRL
jgi:hypothetical protein